MAAVQKSRCWRFVLDTDNAHLPMMLAGAAQYICWKYCKELETCSGFVQYTHARAAGRIPNSTWTKASASFLENAHSYTEYVYGCPAALASCAKRKAMFPPEVLTEEIFAQNAKRDAFILEYDKIELKAKYRASAEKRRRLSAEDDYIRTKKFLEAKQHAKNAKESAALDAAYSLSLIKNTKLCPYPCFYPYVSH